MNPLKKYLSNFFQNNTDEDDEDDYEDEFDEFDDAEYDNTMF